MRRAGVTAEGLDSDMTVQDIFPGEGIEMGEGMNDMESVDS